MPSSKSDKPQPVSTAEFDAKFDDGEDITAHLDLSTVRVCPPDLTIQKVNVDFPAWVVAALDREAKEIGIARQALIKVWISERLKGGRPPGSKAKKNARPFETSIRSPRGDKAPQAGEPSKARITKLVAKTAKQGPKSKSTPA